MRRFIVALLAAFALAVPSTALADPPDGDPTCGHHSQTDECPGDNGSAGCQGINQARDRAGDALVAAASEHIDQAVADERLTQQEADEKKAELPERMAEIVNGEFRGPGPGRFRGPAGDTAGTDAEPTAA